MKERILVVDDNKQIRTLVETILGKEGFLTTGAENAADALKKVKSAKPDLVILDVGLPDRDGFEVCKALRADAVSQHIPVIMLTVQAQPYSRVTGLEVGADDYITKPFHHAEFVSRVKAVLRRAVWRREGGSALEDGPLTVSLNDRTAKLNGKELELFPKEFDLLVYLLHNKGKVITRAELFEAVWEQEYFDTTRTLDVHITMLRKKLGKLGDHIKTLERVGYQYKA